MKWGLDKLAQDEQQVDASMPEGQESSDTSLTCLSNCMYAQNPEKKCMLKAVSLNMGEDGSFECGQYAPVIEQPQEAAMPQPEMPQQPTGLDKLKEQAPQGEVPQQQATGLEKLKGE